jgi:hypothetical protein
MSFWTAQDVDETADEAEDAPRKGRTGKQKALISAAFAKFVPIEVGFAVVELSQGTKGEGKWYVMPFPPFKDIMCVHSSGEASSSILHVIPGPYS